MSFENFRSDLENKMSSIVEFELQEYHYQPNSFGSGMIVYRIKGIYHKFLFDGRDKELVWLKSRSHNQYTSINFSEVKRIDGLKIELEELKNELN